MMSLIKNIAIFILTIAIGLAIGFFAKEQWDQQNIDTVVKGDFSGIYQEAGANVILFATSTCPYCQKSRELLKQHHIAFKEFTLDQSDEGHSLYEKLDISTVPVLLVGDSLINGFSKDDIIAALNQNIPVELEASVGSAP